MSTELTRARRLVSPDFVSKMKAKFKAAALQRMEAEKEVTSPTCTPFLSFSYCYFLVC